MMSECWEALADFESFGLAKRDYQLRHGRTPGTAHAREIAAPFTHARSYFRSARNAERTVKPLLLYYGVVSLSRGLTLLLSRGQRESSLAPSHGLSVQQWGEELSRDNPDFALLRVKVNGAGSFVDLGRATRNKSLLRSNSSAVNHTYQVPPARSSATISLGDILSRIPSLTDHYRRWKGTHLCCEFSTAPTDEARAVIRLPKERKPYINRAFGETIMHGTDFSFQQETDAFVIFDGPNSTEALPGMTDFVNQAVFGIGDLYLVAMYPGETRLSKISTIFGLSYFLGMLVRYFPTQWTALVHGQIDDSSLPTLAAATELVETEYPRLVLEFLADRTSHL